LRGEFSVASQVLLSSDAAVVGLCVRCALVMEHANWRLARSDEVHSPCLLMVCVEEGT